MLIGSDAKPKPCKGMAGLLEEGDEVIEEGEQKNDGCVRLGPDCIRPEGGALRDLGIWNGAVVGRAGGLAAGVDAVGDLSS